MKKFNAVLSALIILVILVFTGCSSNSNASGTQTPAANTENVTAVAFDPGALATSQLKPTPVKNTLKPTASVTYTLDNDTIFDEKTFTVTIPKDAYVDFKDGTYYFEVYSFSYDIRIGFGSVSKGEKTSSITSSSKNLKTFIKEIEKINVKMDGEYSTVTVGGKKGIVLKGKNTDNSDNELQWYLIDTSKGIFQFTVYKQYMINDEQTIKDADSVVSDILSTLTIKK